MLELAHNNGGVDAKSIGKPRDLLSREEWFDPRDEVVELLLFD